MDFGSKPDGTSWACECNALLSHIFVNRLQADIRSTPFGILSPTEVATKVGDNLKIGSLKGDKLNSKTTRAAAAKICLPLMLAALLSLSVPASAQEQSNPSAAPDNSAQNKQQQTTAEHQTNAAGDRHLTAQIRKQIVADKTLSTYAHNIKIITMNGMVTLKGPVKSDEEKQTVADIAAKVAGADKVMNQITVKQQ